jgi:flagellar assembly protein FliH
MPSRIIKSDSAASSQVYGFSFEEPIPAEFTANPADLPLWEDAPRDSHHQDRLSLPASPRLSSEPAAPPVDLAQLEKQAFESGFRQGEKAGLEIAEKKMESVMRRYAETVLELGRLKPALYSQVEREVVRLALEVAKKVVHREIHADHEIIQTLVRVALGHVAEKSAVTIHLHPGDYSYLLEFRAELTNSNDGREIVLVADKSIERGGCLIQTECGDIDARIEEEFREIERAFFDGPR